MKAARRRLMVCALAMTLGAADWPAVAEEAPGASVAGIPDADVVVGVIPHPLSPRKVRRDVWACLPKEPAIPEFRGLSTLGWRERYEMLGAALVAKARAQNLEADALQRALAFILTRETVALAPVAAFRARIGRRDVWIVHLQWELTSRALVKKTKEGPALDDRSIWSLGHICTYAIALEGDEVLAYQTCM